MKGGLRSVSTTSSSASRGWSGKAAGLDLQALRAQVRKLRVRSFIVSLLSDGAVVVAIVGCGRGVQSADEPEWAAELYCIRRLECA